MGQGERIVTTYTTSEGAEFELSRPDSTGFAVSLEVQFQYCTATDLEELAWRINETAKELRLSAKTSEGELEVRH
jgi:hypothetical protein